MIQSQFPDKATPDRADLCSPIELSNVVDMNSGPDTILFLHGLFGSPDHWRTVMDRVDSRFRVVAPQLPIDPAPGRRKNGIKTIGDLTASVHQLIEDLELDSFVLCGNSLGGLVALDLCIQNPGMAKGLVLAGSAGLFERSPIRGLRARPTKKWVRSTVSGILKDQSLVTDELVDHWHRSVCDRDYVRFLLRVSRATRDRTVEDELGDLDVPTMIIWGADDEITPPSTADDFQRLIKGSKLEFIEDCGHAPNWECPEEFADLLSKFVPSCFSE
ncbi:alpha/beta fold hydrolase [Planctomycetes bacterium K23_9]|uniref:2-hydroxy-6-oxo-6-phenylhexa-2,4-dienoate hydrolase n=1 Tax=Stieleria marina TaxID=1930275 RepID=A0A517NW27_9BACT|nr:2-hydroxy-6-oxo-6-phenylhexa-2,4-dienoate hydrolase [Planctomycetes bacterium K23_9]